MEGKGKKIATGIGVAALILVLLNLPGILWPQDPSGNGGPCVRDEVDRLALIPSSRVNYTPALDSHPPVLQGAAAAEFHAPVPLPYPVNTAGGEDSAFVLPDGNTLFFFFTPDVAQSANQQLVDGVTGIYVTHKNATTGLWEEPQRVYLQDCGDPALDGCAYVTDNGSQMWFCTIREGIAREIDIYRATRVPGTDNWTSWESVGTLLNEQYLVGELHLSSDGTELYYHSDRPGGQGGIDLWVTRRLANGSWGTPENLAALNTNRTDGWPWLNQAGDELWFTRADPGAPALYRSRRVNGQWGTPELMVSPFAGEATLDAAGNLYFTHHYYTYDASAGGDVILEADIYVAYRK